MFEKNTYIQIIDWGAINYTKAFELQKEKLNHIVDIKLKNRNSISKQPTPNFLIFCTHPHVFTMGSRGNDKHLLTPKEELIKKEIEVIQSNRGGDITYHGPGQLIMYPILDLDNFMPDLHNYIRKIEEVIILALKEIHLCGERIDKLTGVWIGEEEKRKICAIGIRISRWVTMHGVALNVKTDLSYFQHIIPCGIENKPVTSIEKELKKNISIEEIKNIIIKKFITLFKAKQLPKNE